MDKKTQKQSKDKCSIGTKERAKKWEELTLSDNFLFAKVMRNTSICKELIEKLLDIGEIARIDYPQEEKSIDIRVDSKSVRLDVYVNDDK